MPVDAELGNVFQVRIAGENKGGGLFAPATNSGKSIGGVADHGEVVGDGRGWHAELGDDSGFVSNDFFSAIQLDDTSADDGLAEVFVRRADENLVDAFVLGGFCGG